MDTQPQSSAEAKSQSSAESLLITTQGFQGVVDPITLEVSGFTAIVGETSTGKSSLLRSIRAHLENKRGNDFISKDKDFAENTIQCNGHASTWRKSIKTSEYIIDGIKKEKTGKSTPDLSMLGFFEVLAQGRSYWPQFKKQFEDPFIIGEDSPVAAAELLAASKEGQRLARTVKLAQKAHDEKKTEIALRELALEKAKKKLLETNPYPQLILTRQQTVRSLFTIYTGHQQRQQTLQGVKTRQLRLINQRDSAALRPVDVPQEPPSAAHLQQLFRVRDNNRRLTLAKAVTNKAANLTPPLAQDSAPLKRLLRLFTTQTAHRYNQLRAELRVSKQAPNPPALAPNVERHRKLSNAKTLHLRFNKERSDAQEQQARLEAEIQEVEKERTAILSTLGYCPMCGSVTATQETHDVCTPTEG